MKRYLAMLLALALVVSFVPAFPVQAAEEAARPVAEGGVWNPKVEAGEVVQLPQERSEGGYLLWYDAMAQLRDQMIARNTSISINNIRIPYDATLTQNDLAELGNDLLNGAIVHTGNPKGGDYLYKHIAGGEYAVGYYYDTDQYGVAYYYLTFEYSLIYMTTAAQEAALDVYVEELLAELALDGASDYEKICGIYDYITENIKYDYNGLEDGNDLLKYSAYGALVEKSAVCQGYANLCYRLALELGLDARIIAGTADNGQQVEDHAWNIVAVDGVCYCLDATWDASYVEAGLPYEYFLRGTEFFHTDHFADGEVDYEISATDYDYNYVDSGTCGENAAWSLDENGVLTISGTGTIWGTPWETDYSDQIVKLVVEDGITNIPGMAFNFVDSLTEVVLPGSVTTIGYDAFRACPNLHTVSLSEGLESIDTTAFYDCDALEQIDLPSTLTEIDSSAFGNCDALRSIVIPAGITTLREGLFSGCDNLESVQLPEGLTSIEDDVFSACDSLKDIVIPESVTFLGEHVFYSCDSLTEIRIPDSITVIQDETFSSCDNLKDVFLPESITSIGEQAFYYCESLSRIVIPASVESIGQDCFKYCEALYAIFFLGNAPTIDTNAFYDTYPVVYYPQGDPSWTADVMDYYGGSPYYLPVRLGRCGESLYWYITNGYITNEPGLHIFGSGRMEDYSLSDPAPWVQYADEFSSVRIEENVSYLGEYAFHSCNNLETLGFEGESPEIAQTTFSGVTADAWYFSRYDTWTEDVLQNYGGTITWTPNHQTLDSGSCGENVTWELKTYGTLIISGTGDMAEYADVYSIPWYYPRAMITDVVIKEGVTSICKEAFYDCSNLKNISIPQSVTRIGSHAFLSCTSLESVVLPEGLTEIGAWTFSGCRDLASVYIPEGVTEIGVWAFYGDSSLSEITLPSTLTAIGDNAFGGCDFTSITIPNSVTHIGDDVFLGCYLSRICVDAGNPNYSSDEYGVLFNKNKTLLIRYPGGREGSYTVPKSVVSIEDNAFSITNINGVTLHDGITTIGRSAFSSCEKLTAIRLPNSLKEISYGLLSQCMNLNSVSIPEGVTRIGDMAFSGTDLSRITIPQSIVSIGESAFSVCNQLVEVVIPAGVTSIGSYAFGDCENLQAIHVAEDNTVYSSKNGVLFNKDRTELMVVPGGYTGRFAIPEGVTTIGNNSFTAIRGVTAITVSDTVTYVDGMAFADSLQEIIFDGSAPTFAWMTFLDTTTTVYYPGDDPTWTEEVRQDYHGTITWVPYYTVTEGTCGGDLTWVLESGTLTISGTGAMDSYTSPVEAPWYGSKDAIENVVIEDGVTSVSDYAFYTCADIQTVTIPESLESLGSCVFFDCVTLENVTFLGSAPAIGTNAFNGVSATISYPADDSSWDEDVMQDYGGDIYWKAPYAAAIGDAKYTTVAEALDNAVSGDTVTLIADAVENVHLTINEGVTLDLAGYDLTAKSLNGLSGSYLNATRYGNADHGRLFVAKNRLSLTDAVINGQNKVIPYWDPADGCYVLANTRIKDIDGALIIDEEAKTISFKFSYGAGGAANADFLSDGAEDNALTFVVRLEWESANGIAYQDFVYKNEYVSALANSGGNFTFGLTGYNALSIDLSTFSIQGMILSDSGIIVSGDVYTA